MILKALRRGGLPARMGQTFHGRARLRIEMERLESAFGRGIPTARLAFGAAGSRREGGASTFLATEAIHGALNLAELLGRPSRRERDRIGRRRALESAGRAVRHAHDLGLDHADLNIGNVLVAPGRSDEASMASGGSVAGAGRTGDVAFEGFVIDIGISKLGDPLSPGRRASNLVRLLRSAEKHLGRDPGRLRDAAAFLHGYLASPPGEGRSFRRELLAALRRRLPTIALHRLGWRLSRR
jgi:hypothetical protein